MRAVEGLFDDNRPLHVVMAGPTDDVAFHVELALLARSNLNSSRFARLDWLVDIERLHAEAMLNVDGRDLQGRGLALFKADRIRFNAVFFHYNFDHRRLNRLSLPRLASTGETQYEKH